MNGHQATCDDCGAVSPTYANHNGARESKRWHRCDNVCTACRWSTPRRGHRGLCVRCHLSDARHDAPLNHWTRDELLNEWELLRGDGHTIRQAAERLGMTHSAFQRALCRAKRAGDPRAQWNPTWPNQHTARNGSAA